MFVTAPDVWRTMSARRARVDELAQSALLKRAARMGIVGSSPTPGTVCSHANFAQSGRFRRVLLSFAFGFGRVRWSGGGHPLHSPQGGPVHGVRGRALEPVLARGPRAAVRALR